MKLYGVIVSQNEESRLESLDWDDSDELIRGQSFKFSDEHDNICYLIEISHDNETKMFFGVNKLKWDESKSDQNPKTIFNIIQRKVPFSNKPQTWYIPENLVDQENAYPLIRKST